MSFPSYPLISHLVHSCGGVAEAQELIDAINGGGGSGTVTSVSVVTANGFSGSVASPTTTPAITISQADNSIVYAKLQQASTHTLIGNPTGGTANIQEITLGAGLAFSGSVLNTTGSGSGTVTSVDVSGGTTGLTTSGGPITSSGVITIDGVLGIPNGGTGVTDLGANSLLAVDAGGGVTGVTFGQVGSVLIGAGFLNPPAFALVTGDVTIASNGVTTISTNAVTYAKIQQASTHTLLGNPTGSTANVQEITLGSGLSFSGGTLVASASTSQAQIVAHIWGEF